MKELELSNSDMTAMVDDEDYDSLSNYRWSLKLPHKDNRNHYVVRQTNKTENLGKTAIMLHNQIMGPSPVGFVIDHLDNNGLNNQKNNLRFRTESANRANGRQREKSGFQNLVGVRQSNEGPRSLLSACKYQGKTYIFGRSRSAEWCAFIRDAAVVSLYGLPVLLNYPELKPEYLKWIESIPDTDIIPTLRKIFKAVRG